MASPIQRNIVDLTQSTMRKSVETNRNVSHSDNPQSTPTTALTSGLVQRAQAGPHALTPTDMVSLQRNIGNQALQRMLSTKSPLLIQPKLKVGPANDHYEQEADRIASTVMRQINSSAKPNVGKVKKGVQRSQSGPMGMAGGAIDSQMESSIQRQRGGGRPLDDATRTKMESAFGTDFSGVKVHTNTQADQLNRSINAEAFTTGQDVFFRSGNYAPHSAGGQKLLAHELTHVVQQSGGQSTGPINRKINKTSAPAIQRVLSVGGDIYDDDEMEESEFDQHKVSPETQSQQDVNSSSYNFVMGGQNITNSSTNWRKVKENIEGYDSMKWSEKRGIKKRFKKWVNREGKVDHTKGKKLFGGITTEMIKIAFGKKSEDRRYKDWKSVGTALVGEQRAKKNKEKEKDLAKSVSKQKDFRRDLVSVLQTLYNWIETEVIPDDPNFWKNLQDHRGKKFRWVYGNANMRSRLQNPVANKVSSNFAIFHDVMFYAGRSAAASTKQKSDMFGMHRGAPDKRSHIHMPGEEPTVGYVGAGAFEKGGQHAMMEDNQWVKSARARNMPVGAGASNTTYALMNFGQSIGLDGKQKEALAWAAFIYWNKKFKQVEARGHTFHEVMDVANLSTDGDVRYNVDSDNPYNVGYGAKNKSDRTWSKPTPKTERDFPMSGFTLSSQRLGNMRRGRISFDGFSLQEMESMSERDIFLLAAELRQNPKAVFDEHASELKKLRKAQKKLKNKSIVSSPTKVEKTVEKTDEIGESTSPKVETEETVTSPSQEIEPPQDEVESENEEQTRTLSRGEKVVTVRSFDALDRRARPVTVPSGVLTLIVSVSGDEVAFEAIVKPGSMMDNIRGTAHISDILGAI